MPEETLPSAPAMTPERWRRIKEIFDEAIECETGLRDRLLDEACGNDADLRVEVENLLKGHAQASGFIEKPAIGHAIPTPEKPTLDPMVGLKIDHYQILRELGHGGMGQVYLAVRADDEYKKRVAFKALKRGMDTRDIRRRFRRERQILAALDHPNIAKLLDGGTTEDGLPYFVMEYVEGKPITEYCDNHKLSTIERLKLFRQVCAAVQFAHQNLVIHRDIKPSNILVTEDGTPKLLDFGIAKLLNPELSGQTIDPTATALRMMTPEYASPEQVRGETVTTASDVYSLGVVLYELLTGHRPYRVKSRAPHEIIRVVCEEEPDKPSTAVNRVDTQPNADGTTRDITPESVSQTREGEPERLRRRLRGDLDNIVLMAMRKEPQRRYTTVNQLSEDIRRHLEGLPVVARQDTITYRVEKFIQRNRAGVIAAAIVLLTLVGGIITTAWQARIARQERARAQQRFNDVRGLATSFLFDLHKEISELTGSLTARKMLVGKALETYGKLAGEAQGDASLQFELADAYRTVSNIQWSRYYAHLGDLKGALESARAAETIYQRLAAEEKNQQALNGLGNSYVQIGDLLIEEGKMAEALDYYRKSLKLREDLVRADPKNAAKRWGLMISHQRLGDHLGNPNFSNLGDVAGAMEHYEKMLKIDEELAAEFPQNPQYSHAIAIACEKFRDLRWKMGDQNGAFEIYRRGLEMLQSLADKYPDSSYHRDLAIFHRKTGLMFQETGETAKALTHYKTALYILQPMAKESNNAKARSDLISVYQPLAQLLLKSGDQAGALEAYRHLLSLRQEVAAAPNANANDLNEYAWLLLTVESPSLRNPGAALSYAKRAVEMSGGQDANILDTLAKAYYLAGNPAKAVETQEKALSLLKPDAPGRQDLEAALAEYRAALRGKAK